MLEEVDLPQLAKLHVANVPEVEDLEWFGTYFHPPTHLSSHRPTHLLSPFTHPSSTRSSIHQQSTHPPTHPLSFPRKTGALDLYNEAYDKVTARHERSLKPLSNKVKDVLFSLPTHPPTHLITQSIKPYLIHPPIPPSDSSLLCEHDGRSQSRAVRGRRIRWAGVCD